MTSACPTASWPIPARALVRVVRSEAYRRLLADLPGYDTARTGEIQPVAPAAG